MSVTICFSNHAINQCSNVVYRRLWFDLLAVVSVVSYRIWQPARLVVQPVEFRHQAHSNGSPHPCVHDGHLHTKSTHSKYSNHGQSYLAYHIIRARL